MTWRGSITVERHDEPADTMTITFDPPIEHKGGHLAEINLKEPTARQVREAEKAHSIGAALAGAVSYEMKLVGVVAGIADQGLLDLLPVSAINHGHAFLQDFIEAPADEDETLAEDEAPHDVLLPLDPPITFGKEAFTELDLHEPLASQLRQARQLISTSSLFESRRAQMHLITAVAGVPAPVVDALPIRTLNKAGRILSGFTIAGRRTGKT